MTWYAFIHPLMAIGTIALGLVTSQTSLSKLNDWDFPLTRQRSRSVMVFLLTAANFVVGLVANAIMRGRGAGLKLTAHMPLGIVVMVLAAIAAVITFGRSRSGELSPIMRWHPVLSVLALALTLTMGFLTALPFIFK